MLGREQQVRRRDGLVQPVRRSACRATAPAGRSRRRGTTAPPRAPPRSRAGASRARAACAHRCGSSSETITPQGPHAGRPRRLDERLLAQRQHLPAQRPRHVRHVHEPDHDDRDQLRARPDLDRARSSHPWSVSAVLSRAPSSSAGNDQSRSNSRLIDRVGAPAAVAGREPERNREQQRQQHGAARRSMSEAARAVEQPHHRGRGRSRPRRGSTRPARSGRSGSPPARRRPSACRRSPSAR